MPRLTMITARPCTGGVAFTAGAVYTTGLVCKETHLGALFKGAAMVALQEEAAGPRILTVPPLPPKFNGLVSPTLPGFKEVEEDGGGL